MNVAILGYGLEGESAYKYYKKLGATITIHDEADQPKQALPDHASFIGGAGSFDGLGNYDVVVRTPQINPDRIVTDGTLTSVTKLFFSECKRPIIGITGTKGKGTTASLIHALLKAGGVKSWLVGNIGTPALDLLDEINEADKADDGIVIYELSSFQLWDMQQSPQVAVVLMIEPDHLEVHGHMDDYVTAKANIARWQTADDAVIYHPSNPLSRGIAEQSKGRHIPFGEDPAAHEKDGNIYLTEQLVCSVSEVLLPGKHNLENIFAALTAASQFTGDIDAFAGVLRQFKGLPHRLEQVATKHDVTYYDDSFSSMPGATEVAIAAFSQPKVLIIGGYDRGLSFAKLAAAIASSGTIRSVLLVGQTRHRLAEAMAAAGFSDYEISEAASMHDIVARATSLARPGDVVLLSPGCASFDMFKNFYERGQQFQHSVKAIGETV